MKTQTDHGAKPPGSTAASGVSDSFTPLVRSHIGWVF